MSRSSRPSSVLGKRVIGHFSRHRLRFPSVIAEPFATAMDNELYIISKVQSREPPPPDIGQINELILVSHPHALGRSISWLGACSHPQSLSPAAS